MSFSRIDREAAEALLEELAALQTLLSDGDAAEPPVLNDVIVVGHVDSAVADIETEHHNGAAQPSADLPAEPAQFASTGPAAPPDDANALLAAMTQRLDANLATLRDELLKQLHTEIQHALTKR